MMYVYHMNYWTQPVRGATMLVWLCGVLGAVFGALKLSTLVSCDADRVPSDKHKQLQTMLWDSAGHDSRPASSQSCLRYNAA